MSDSRARAVLGEQGAPAHNPPTRERVGKSRATCAAGRGRETGGRRKDKRSGELCFSQIKNKSRRVLEKEEKVARDNKKS